jgi:hypothetical protein
MNTFTTKVNNINGTLMKTCTTNATMANNITYNKNKHNKNICNTTNDIKTTT